MVRYDGEVVEVVTNGKVYIIPSSFVGKRMEIGVYDDWVGDKVVLDEIKDAIAGFMESAN